MDIPIEETPEPDEDDDDDEEEEEEKLVVEDDDGNEADDDDVTEEVIADAPVTIEAGVLKSCNIESTITALVGPLTCSLLPCALREIENSCEDEDDDDDDDDNDKCIAVERE
jgi:hypothetical protein